jgi:hypothetical protein
VSAPPEKANARRQPGERVILTDCTPSRASLAHGVNLIQFWPISARVTRIQTLHPAIARELRRLKDTRQVGESVAGGYLRLFDSTQPLRKLRKTLKRIEQASRRTLSPKEGLRKSLASAPYGAGRYPHLPETKAAVKASYLASGISI